MTENLKNITYHLIEKYIDILEKMCRATIAYLNEPVGLLDSRRKVQILRLLNPQKVEANRMLLQIILVLGPILVLGLFFFNWTGYRKRQFGQKRALGS